MDLIDQLQALAVRIEKQLPHITTEEATKNAFVMPFIQSLGFDIFDPTEVVPEFTADVGSKKGEKVDYAIYIDGKPAILFECKHCSANLKEAHASQLRRYFHVTEARIGILTNGQSYYFYTDLEKPNIMDEKPFMEINLKDLDPQFIPELKKLAKSTFEIDKMLTTANELKYVRAIKNLLSEEMNGPTVDFVRYIVSKVYSGMKTQQVIDQFSPIVKNAIKHFVNDQISERLKTAMITQDDPRDSAEQEGQAEVATGNETGVVTTQEELEGYYVIRAILRQVVDVNRVVMRDTKSYFGILLDDNNRKPLCRLHFNSTQKYLGTIGADKKETRNPIASLDDIYNFSDQIKAAVSYYAAE